jgi:hypothetical protein
MACGCESDGGAAGVVIANFRFANICMRREWLRGKEFPLPSGKSFPRAASQGIVGKNNPIEIFDNRRRIGPIDTGAKTATDFGS